MAKTTINLEDDIYKKLVKEAVERYGTTRTLSKLINEKLKRAETMKTKGERRKSIDIVEKTAGLWKIKESGSEYVRRLRKESEERFKRLGI
jgi:predicted CopG family antitoxin